MKTTFLLAAAALLASCSQTLKVEVANNTQIERDDETVEIAWAEIATLKGVTPENVIVVDNDGEQIPSQVIFRGQTEPQALIFQMDADQMEVKEISIKTGVREAYTTEAYGRQVPERYDDYAWENDKIAYRVYGQALESSPEQLTSPAIDIWVKSTDKMVINDWYAKADYHHNYGEGMDCYKAGKTLGGGSALPFTGGKFWLMGHNYASQQTLDNGPIRTSVKLTYAPFEVDSVSVTLTRTISLDANQHFNRIENIYEGAFTKMPIAAGFARHDVKTFSGGNGWFALQEAASDTKDPARDGDIYAAVVLPGAQILPDSISHALAIKDAKPGEALIYYAGAGWSQGGIDDMAEWQQKVTEKQAEILTPLQVTIRK